MTSRLLLFGYARKSSIDPRHRKEVESTDRQVARLRAWAAQQGHDLEIFAEPDGRRSGGSIDHRPAYQQMLQRLRSARPGEIAGIVTTELDRTGRDELDMYQLFDEVVERGLRLIVLDDPSLNLESTDGRFLAGLKVLLAAQERRKAGDRVKAALHDRRARGFHVGGVPYGYRSAHVTTEAGHTVKTLEPNPEEAERLLAILEKYVAGAGIDSLARWCNALGWRTRRGGTWTAVSINELLIHVMTYRGLVLVRDERQRVVEMIPGRHPPLIGEQLAAAVVAAKQRRGTARQGGRHALHEYPLVHLAWCAECGSHIVGATQNKDKRGEFDAPRFFYRCKKDLGECSSSRMHALPLEAQVWAVLDRFREQLADAARRMPELADIVPPRRLPEPSAAGAIRAELARLNTMFQKGRISEEKYDRDYEQLEQRLAAATASVETIGSPADPLGLLAVENLMSQLDLARESGTRAALPRVARALVERVEVRDATVILCRLIPPLEQLRELLAELQEPSFILYR